MSEENNIHKTPEEIERERIHTLHTHGIPANLISGTGTAAFDIECETCKLPLRLCQCDKETETWEEWLDRPATHPEEFKCTCEGGECTCGADFNHAFHDMLVGMGRKQCQAYGVDPLEGVSDLDANSSASSFMDEEMDEDSCEEEEEDDDSEDLDDFIDDSCSEEYTECQCEECKKIRNMIMTPPDWLPDHKKVQALGFAAKVKDMEQKARTELDNQAFIRGTTTDICNGIYKL